MKKRAMLPAWGRILRGYRPFLSVEITKECPLRCPGCYAYQDGHLNNGTVLRQLADYKGDQLVNSLLDLVRRTRPLHLSIVGGEPLVRYRELGVVIPKLNAMGIEVQLVTSAVRRIPREWAAFDNLHLAVSIDGLQKEHDARRTPATYERILRHIEGHQIIAHCTVTRQLVSREGYLREFARFWSERKEVRKIWFSLFTPQESEISPERLEPEDRRRAIRELAAIQPLFPKVYMPDVVLNGFRQPPSSPEECMFAQITTCVSSDLSTAVTPCQLGGQPKCTECGCIAAAGFKAMARFKLGGLVSIASILNTSKRFGERFQQAQARVKPPSVAPASGARDYTRSLSRK